MLIDSKLLNTDRVVTVKLTEAGKRIYEDYCRHHRYGNLTNDTQREQKIREHMAEKIGKDNFMSISLENYILAFGGYNQAESGPYIERNCFIINENILSNPDWRELF